MSKLAEIKTLLAAITPELWVAVARHSGNDGTQDEMDGLGWDIEGPPEPLRGQFSRCADAQFVAHSPEYVALLLAVVEAALTNDWTGHVTTPQCKAEHYRVLSLIPIDRESPRSKELREWAKAWEGIA